MDQYITGAAIRAARERRHMTQAALAEKISVSDKTVSKWETGRGLPDITLLEPLAGALGLSVAELLTGSAVRNTNPGGGMHRGSLYVCPVCGNILFALGQAVISCCGVTLMPQEAEAPEGAHAAHVTPVEDEWLVEIDHPMEKDHYISFIAALSDSGLQLIRLYPEGAAQARISRGRVRRLFWYCNRDGLFGTKSPKNL